MKKPNWAYAKAAQHMRGYMNLKTEQELFAHLAKLLRAERARAVRVCRKLAKHCNDKMTEDDSPEGQAVWSDKKDACLDCAAAIGGGRA